VTIHSESDDQDGPSEQPREQNHQGKSAPQTNHFDRLVDDLRKKDPHKNQFAVDIFLRLGGAVVPLLVEEATGPGKQPAHRIRLLDVVQTIGVPLTALDYHHVFQLGRHRVRHVRKKAAEVLAALHPDGPPPLLPEELMGALDRMFLSARGSRGRRTLRNSTRRRSDPDGRPPRAR
jgi:hypothetical protein